MFDEGVIISGGGCLRGLKFWRSQTFNNCQVVPLSITFPFTSLGSRRNDLRGLPLSLSGRPLTFSGLPLPSVVLRSPQRFSSYINCPSLSVAVFHAIQRFPQATQRFSALICGFPLIRICADISQNSKCFCRFSAFFSDLRNF